MYWLLCENSKTAKFARTVLQVVLGFITAYLPYVLGVVDIPEWAAVSLAAIVACALSPIMAKLGETYYGKDVG